MVDYETLVLTGIIGFLTTLSGVLIAFALTLSYDRKKKQEEERETRSRVAKAIQLELEGNLEIINENRQKFEKEQQQGFLILFPSGAYQSAIGSGFLSLLDSKLQYNLASTYAGFKWVESVSSRVLSMIGGVDMSVTNYADNLKAFQAVIDTQLKRLQEAIPSLVKEVISQQIDERDASVSKVTSTSTGPQGTAGVQLSQNPNRDIDLHKIDLAANHRLGLLGAMTGAYFAFIVGLLVAWYTKFGSGDIVVYYTGVALIGGVLVSMLITQELIPYMKWFRQIDGWLQTVEEGRERLHPMKELVQFKDRLQSTGHLILIFLVVFDFYVTVLGTYDKVQVFITFTIAGATVAFLTQGGPKLLRDRRKVATK